MVRLFVSDRIFIDGSFCNGGIVVNNDGQIEEVFRDPVKVEKWLDLNSHVEVSCLQCTFKMNINPLYFTIRPTTTRIW